MKVEKILTEEIRKPGFRLLDDEGQSIEEVEGYLSYLVACGSSPNTVQAYAYDLLHFYSFLNERSVGWEAFTPALSLAFFEHLSKMPGRNFRVQRFSPVLVSEKIGEEGPATVLSPNSVNRTMACVSSYFGYLIFSGRSVSTTNPVQKKPDPALARVPERRKPFLHGIATKRPSSRVTCAKTVLRVPRPLPDGHFEKLLRSLTKLRDRAMFLLMEQGGLRPGEVLCLKLEDVQYGRRRVIVRHREDHPKGARTKSRVERVVDLHEPEALATLSAYVMGERPLRAKSPFIFLVGGNGKRRFEPLSYSALHKVFVRQCEKLGIRTPWTTPHALRHSHATRMWEGGMRELTLQKRLGHASPNSTRLYTRVSDAAVVEEYRRALMDGG